MTSTITTAIHKISQTLARELDKAESPLTGTQLMALKAISENDGCNQTLVVEQTGIDRSTLADVVRRLMRTGLISRKRSKADSRANVLTITKTGTKALAKADQARKKAEKQVIRIFDTAAALGLDLAGAIIEKNRFNKDRADHKLAARAAGGKRY